MPGKLANARDTPDVETNHHVVPILFEAVPKVDLAPGSGRGSLGRFVHVKFH